jgi:hypothetical protein
VAFIRPDTTRLDVVPPPVSWRGAPHSVVHGPGSFAFGTPDNPLSATDERLAAAGIVVHRASTPCWDGTPFDVGLAIDVLRGREPLPSHCTEQTRSR